ncbi:MAG: STAS domain-containing protein [Rhodospirillaceae bacterium]
MDKSLTSFIGNKLTVDVEVLRTPSGTVIANVRPVGSMITSERETISESIDFIKSIDGQFVVMDTTEVGSVDSWGIGTILMLNGELALKQRRFSIVVQDGAVCNFLRRVGVMEIIRSRPLIHQAA